MITSICKIMTKIFLSKKIIDGDDQEIYQYGLEVLLSTLFGGALILIAGIMTGNFLESLAFYSVFATLRIFCGGYHANTYLKCKLLFVLTFILILFTSIYLKALNNGYLTTLVLAILSSFVVFVYAPVEHKNKPLNDCEKKKYSKLSKVIVLGWIIASCFLHLLGFINISVVINLAILSIALLMLISKYMERKIYTHEKRK